MNLLQTRNQKSSKVAAQKIDRIYRFLAGKRTGVLATTGAGGIPHAAAIYYSVSRSINITFITKRKTDKSTNLSANNRAMLVVFDEAEQATAQLAGTVKEVTDTEEAHQVFMQALRSSLYTGESAIPPVARLSAGDYIAYRLEPDHIKMAAYKRRISDNQGDMFETLDKIDLKL